MRVHTAEHNFAVTSVVTKQRILALSMAGLLITQVNCLRLKIQVKQAILTALTKTAHTTLKKVARFESYKGFLFGSLNPDVPSLEEFLGETTKIIDMIVDQSEHGLEVLRGSSTYTYEGNWKLTAENGADGYHVSAVHWNYAATTQHRKETQAADNIRAMSAGSWGKQGGGSYGFENGHMLLLDTMGKPRRPP